MERQTIWALTRGKVVQLKILLTLDALLGHIHTGNASDLQVYFFPAQSVPLSVESNKQRDIDWLHAEVGRIQFVCQVYLLKLSDQVREAVRGVALAMIVEIGCRLSHQVRSRVLAGELLGLLQR